jgi:site-specific DNA-methyltransferase (adenine-specific)
MEYMKDCDNNAFDLAIVDPPYGIREDGHRENNRSKLAISTNYHKALWDQDRPTKKYFDELKRVSKNQIIWGGNHLCDLSDMKSPCWIVWDKDNSGHFADCELAYTSFQTAVRMFKYTWNGMLQGDMKNKERRIHPTQKPVKLYEWLLTNYAEPGQRILDTHLGSGSSAIAAHYFGVDFVGCELDKDYYQSAMKRFDRETAQVDMFAP